MIDLEARHQATLALTRFLEGVTTTDDFLSEYPNPRKTSDRAIRAIDTMIWHFYDDHRVHTLSGLHALDPTERQLFERCLLFLKSARPYEWSVDNFIMPGEPDRVMNFLTFGLTGRLHRRRERIVQEALDKEGDYSVWPFISRSDFVAQSSRPPRHD